MIRSDQWIPQGVIALEPRADEVVKNFTDNIVVIAGPGAGKSELLAQKTCFLLQTGVCPDPYRILAISFKRDAEKNIRERVQRRCGGLANRFDSYTFDGFAKSILDRFIDALPNNYKPSNDYMVDLSLFNDSNLEANLSQILNGYEGVTRRDFENKYMATNKLPYTHTEHNINVEAAKGLWKYLLSLNPSKLSFKMISRLTELIINTNPNIKKALQSTYKYIFIDEFQDTTYLQYDFVKSCFLNSECKITAVGDPKQRIMDFAGALEGIFEHFQEDFNTPQPYYLQHNYRSAPELVQIQHAISCFLEGKESEAVHSQVNFKGKCDVWEFSNYEIEANDLAIKIKTYIDNGAHPREICVLARNRPDDYAEKLVKTLQELNIKARNESNMQDILADDCIKLIISTLKLMTPLPNPEAWRHVNDFFAYSRSLLEDNELRKAEETISNFIKVTSNSPIIEIINEIIKFLDKKFIASVFPQHTQIDYLDSMIKITQKYFDEYIAAGMELHEAIEEFEGTKSIPIMTIHKSKGLEYNTVIVVGLEDSAFWEFSNAPRSETCNFFVALSRAKQNIIFTTSQFRPVGRYPNQSTRQIAQLYDLLEIAGVHREFIG